MWNILMNIVQVYNKFQKQLVILISGLSGSGKTKLARRIESGYADNDVPIKYIDLEAYCKKENDKKIELPNNMTVTDWEHIDVYDWEQFNKDVNEVKENGVVISGIAFPKNKLDFQPDFHIHVRISKRMLVEKRKEFLERHKDK